VNKVRVTLDAKRWPLTRKWFFRFEGFGPFKEIEIWVHVLKPDLARFPTWAKENEALNIKLDQLRQTRERFFVSESKRIRRLSITSDAFAPSSIYETVSTSFFAIFWVGAAERTKFVRWGQRQDHPLTSGLRQGSFVPISLSLAVYNRHNTRT
jgi:hypothetical protein